MAHLRPHYFGEKEKWNPPRGSGPGMGMLNTCPKFHGLSKKTAWTFRFLCVKKIPRWFKLLCFSAGSIFFARFCLILTCRLVRSSTFCTKNFTDIPWSTSNRFVQNVAQLFFSPPLGKSLNTIEEYEGLSLIDTSFAPPRGSPRPLKYCPCHPLPLVMGVSMIPNIHPLTGYCKRHSPGREFRYSYVNQPGRAPPRAPSARELKSESGV